MKLYFYCFKEFEILGYVFNKDKILKFIEKYNISIEEVVIKEKSLHLVLLDFLTGYRIGSKRLKRFKKLEKLKNEIDRLNNRIDFLENCGVDVKKC